MLSRVFLHARVLPAGLRLELGELLGAKRLNVQVDHDVSRVGPGYDVWLCTPSRGPEGVRGEINGRLNLPPFSTLAYVSP